MAVNYTWHWHMLTKEYVTITTQQNDLDLLQNMNVSKNNKDKYAIYGQYKHYAEFKK